MRAELIPLDGGSPIAILKDITVIGRREFCDVQLDDPSLSKRHCVIIKTDGLLMIRDLASTNGTRVKGQLVRWAALLPNDRIAIGKLKFRVFLGPAKSPAKPEPKAKKPRRDHPEATHPSGSSPARPRSAVPVVRPVQVTNDRPELNLGDSRWFDKVASAQRDDEIIDLD